MSNRMPRTIRFIDYNDDFDDMQDKAAFALQNELREADDPRDKLALSRALTGIKSLDENDPNGNQKTSRILQDLKQTSVTKNIMDLIVGIKLFFG